MRVCVCVCVHVAVHVAVQDIYICLPGAEEIGLLPAVLDARPVLVQVVDGEGEPDEELLLHGGDVVRHLDLRRVGTCAKVGVGAWRAQVTGCRLQVAGLQV